MVPKGEGLFIAVFYTENIEYSEIHLVTLRLKVWQSNFAKKICQYLVHLPRCNLARIPVKMCIQIMPITPNSAQNAKVSAKNPNWVKKIVETEINL